MNLFTFTVLSFILFFGCTVSLGVSYDEEQMNLQEQDKSKDLVESLTSGQYAFLIVGMLSGLSAGVSAIALLVQELSKNG